MPLTPDQVKALLAQRQTRTDHPTRLEVIGLLPETLRTIAYGLLYRDANGKELSTDYRRHAARFSTHARALSALDTLSPSERTDVFAAFLPQIANEVELGWSRLRTLPYTATYFRATSRPDLSLRARGDWLQSLLYTLSPQDELPWIARHGGYLARGSSQLGLLLAAVIDSNSPHADTVFGILLATARGEDDTALYGQHVPVALLASSRPEGWDCVERLLLGAQREEGVRQTLLDALRYATLPAFSQILGVILEHNLVRFSAITHAVNAWLGTSWESDQAKAVTQALRGLHTQLGDPHARLTAIEHGDSAALYLGLWVTAFEDIALALPIAARLLDDPEPTRRFAATRLLAMARFPEAAPLLARALLDADGRVAGQACVGLRDVAQRVHIDEGAGQRAATDQSASGVFERIEAALPHAPRRPTTPAPVLWNSPTPSFDGEMVADLLVAYLEDRDVKRLLPYLSQMSVSGRLRATMELGKRGLDDATVRDAIVALLRDRSSSVSDTALKLLLEAPIAESEAPSFEALLGRKSADMRRGVLSLLLKLPDEAALASAERLLASAHDEHRLAGLELLSLLRTAHRAERDCETRAANFQSRRPAISPAEQNLLTSILSAEFETPTLENALGLAPRDTLSPLSAPVPRGEAWTSAAAVAALQSLDALIHEHRADSYIAAYGQTSRETLLGNEAWNFPSINTRVAIADDIARLPFAEMWRGWLDARPVSQRDSDGLELLRMILQLYRRGDDVTRALLMELGDAEAVHLSLRYPRIFEPLCWWFVRLLQPAGAADFALDHLETTLAQIPESELREPEQADMRPRWREFQKLQRAVSLARAIPTTCPTIWTEAHAGRLWRLLKWSASLPQPHLRYSPALAETVAAHRAGVASDADVMYQLIGERPTAHGSYGRGGGFGELHTLSSRKPSDVITAHPFLGELYRRCAARVVEVELQRGEMPTAATDAALSLRSLRGMDTFFGVLRALGSQSFSRGYGYGERGNAYVLSHLLRVTFPTEADTPESFSARAKAERIPQRRLIEAAVYAPQWSQHVERTLEWDGFAEGVWWVQAHTKERNWFLDEGVREEWEATINAWTPLTSADLYDGAVDVTWFRRVIASLGETRWEALYAAAKYSSGGAGHARVRLSADAMLGRIEASTLLPRIAAKRNRDAACALGLLPLPAGATARKAAVLQRYQALQEFIRTSKAFGAQRREGDQKAARIGLENLARTAGYVDPLRFQWAMELEEVADLAAGPLHVARDAVTVSLSVNPLGQPLLRVDKGGKPLKEIPPRLKKDPEIAALRERKTRLEQQSARMRLALEQAMCREEAFTAGELAALLRHPLLAPMLEQLVFTGAGSLGYLANGAATLRTLDGDTPLDPQTPLRIAHSHDLYASGAWTEFQHECFVSERIQPFKQVFRELYVLTEAEKRDGSTSGRYAGHQLQNQQAMALLATRGWVTSPQDGTAERAFHGRGVTASVDFLYGGGTVVDVEGLTVESVAFHTTQSSGVYSVGHLALQDVAPIVFSEAMRDLDLVVSVAHRGGVDPEGSASTMEMRAALVREVCAALSLNNVRVQSSHVVIAGALGEYSVHLGSGIVHRLPGGSLCIIPVHAQHRGRIFLPFADDDPKSAEILSKTLLLARDTEIKDPLILQQLYARVL